jgi:hypothetical protein
VQRTSRRQLAEKACSWPHARASAPKLVGLSVASLLPAIGRSLRVRHEHFTDPDWRVRSVEGPTRHGRSAAHVRRCDRQMSMQKVPRWSRWTVPTGVWSVARTVPSRLVCSVCPVPWVVIGGGGRPGGWRSLDVSQNKLFKTHYKTPVPTPTHTNARTQQPISVTLSSPSGLYIRLSIYLTPRLFPASVNVDPRRVSAAVLVRVVR